MQLTCAVYITLTAQTTHWFSNSKTELIRCALLKSREKIVNNFLFFSLVHPTISLNPGPRHEIQGNTFTLPFCQVTGYPTPEVTWRKPSGLLPHGRVRYNNSALQILRVRKEDSEFYTCSAENPPGKVVVSLPRFTSKPPSKIVSLLSSTVRLNCSATGDPQPIISWRKQGGQLPVGRSQQINRALVITTEWRRELHLYCYKCQCVRCGSCNRFGNKW